jgi:hypothetical protein
MIANRDFHALIGLSSIPYKPRSGSRKERPGRAFPTKYSVFYGEIPFLCETFVK